jgi:hypothetical protein
MIDNYIKRTGRIPEDPMDDLKILKDGMNVK